MSQNFSIQFSYEYDNHSYWCSNENPNVGHLKWGTGSGDKNVYLNKMFSSDINTIEYEGSTGSAIINVYVPKNINLIRVSWNTGSAKIVFHTEGQTIIQWENLSGSPSYEVKKIKKIPLAPKDILKAMTLDVKDLENIKFAKNKKRYSISLKDQNVNGSLNIQLTNENLKSFDSLKKEKI